jgi:hypothetical protein
MRTFDKDTLFISRIHTPLGSIPEFVGSEFDSPQDAKVWSFDNFNFAKCGEEYFYRGEKIMVADTIVKPEDITAFLESNGWDDIKDVDKVIFEPQTKYAYLLKSDDTFFVGNEMNEHFVSKDEHEIIEWCKNDFKKGGYGWQLTDPDTNQFCKKISEYKYAFTETRMGIDGLEYDFEAEIDLLEYYEEDYIKDSDKQQLAEQVFENEIDSDNIDKQITNIFKRK